MTTLPHRPNTALLVIDVQNGVMADAVNVKPVLATIADLVDRARRADVPVVWVQHSSDQLSVGSDAWQYVPELVKGDNEPTVHKKFGDSFEGTALEKELADREVGHVVIAGAQTDACVRSTLHGAFVRGYDTTLVEDAHTTQDLTAYGAPAPEQVIAHTNLYWSFQRAPGRTAAVVPAAEVEFAPAAH